MYEDTFTLLSESGRLCEYIRFMIISGANQQLYPAATKRWMKYQLYKITGEEQDGKVPRTVSDKSVSFPQISYDENDARFNPPNSETPDLPVCPHALLGVPVTLYPGTLKTIKFTTASQIFELLYHDICSSIRAKDVKSDENEENYDITTSSSSSSSSLSSSSSSTCTQKLSLSETDKVVMLASTRKQSKQRSSYNPPSKIVDHVTAMKMKNEDSNFYAPSVTSAQDVYASSSNSSSSYNASSIPISSYNPSYNSSSSYTSLSNNVNVQALPVSVKIENINTYDNMNTNNTDIGSPAYNNNQYLNNQNNINTNDNVNNNVGYNGMYGLTSNITNLGTAAVNNNNTTAPVSTMNNNNNYGYNNNSNNNLNNIINHNNNMNNNINNNNHNNNNHNPTNNNYNNYGVNITDRARKAAMFDNVINEIMKLFGTNIQSTIRM